MESLKTRIPAYKTNDLLHSFAMVTPPCKHSTSRALFLLNTEMFSLHNLASPGQHRSGDRWLTVLPSV